ncbi:MAG: hypothetical protein JWO89_179, partial [Verrucomicrobiaceae bacterium]|nr:hypothetical protein [Verrucomicrobiaceae bacterium]
MLSSRRLLFAVFALLPFIAFGRDILVNDAVALNVALDNVQPGDVLIL